MPFTTDWFVTTVWRRIDAEPRVHLYGPYTAYKARKVRDELIAEVEGKMASAPDVFYAKAHRAFSEFVEVRATSHEQP